MVNNVGEFLLVKVHMLLNLLRFYFILGLILFPFFANSLSYITIPQTRKNMI